MFPRYQTMTAYVPSVAASGSASVPFRFARKVRIKRYWIVPTVANAASASVTVVATFTDKGSDSSGSTLLATLTNDTDSSDSITLKEGAWAANVAKEIDTENRPGSPTHAQNSMDEIAAGDVILVAIAAAASVVTSAYQVGIEYVESD